MKHRAQHLSKLFFLGMFAVILTFVSCWKSNGDDPTPPSGSDARTVIGLIFADNSLDSFSDSDINEMISGMKNSSIDWNYNNVVLFIDSKLSAPLIINLKREKNKSNDYVIVKDTIFKYTQETIANISDIDFAESSTTTAMCKDALKRIMTEYKALSYGLILWSHGDGWIPSNNLVTPTISTRKFGQDTNTGTVPSTKWLENSELKTIIDYSCNLMTNQEHKYEFIYTDACEMANITTVYDLKDYCKYFVGSVAETPGDGGYYVTQLPAMFDSSNPAFKLAEAYNTRYNGTWHWAPGAGAQLSVIKTSELEHLARVTKSFLEQPTIAASIASIDWSEMHHFDWGHVGDDGSIIYHNSQQIAFIYYDFQQIMETVLTSDQLSEWKNALQRAVVKNYVPDEIYSIIIQRNFSANPCCGLAAYFPGGFAAAIWTNTFQNYAWYKAAGLNYIQEAIR